VSTEGVVNLLTLGRPLQVLICQLCASLYLAEGERAHDAVHHAAAVHEHEGERIGKTSQSAHPDDDERPVSELSDAARFYGRIYALLGEETDNVLVERMGCDPDRLAEIAYEFFAAPADELQAAIRADDELLDDLGDGAPAAPGDVLGEHLAAFVAEVDREDPEDPR
jgi:hypothetical protein